MMHPPENKAMRPPTARQGIILVAYPALEMTLRRLADGERLMLENWPVDARILTVAPHSDPRNDVIAVKVESASFPETVEGGLLPIIDIRICSLEPPRG